MIKHLTILFLITSFLACKAEKAEPRTIKVNYAGALKNIMHKGEISAQADLKDFENVDHFYALGATENLKGEIQIFNSKAYNTSFIDSIINFDDTFDKKATLLVYATVKNWKSIEIPEHINTYEALEDYISQTAKTNNINIEEPFPFLIEGKPKSIDWHVINWKDGDMEHSHQKHITSGRHGKLNNIQVEMLGFYSDSHHAIFTHHSTNMHIHMVTDDKQIAGHVDGLRLDKGMILKLPD